MGNPSNTGDQSGRGLRWVARGAGVLAAGFWLFVGAVGAIRGSEPWTVESGILAGLTVVAAIGVAVGWWREGIGGGLLLAVAVAYGTFAYLAAGHNKGLAVSVAAVPFLLVGLLFLASWWKSSKGG